MEWAWTLTLVEKDFEGLNSGRDMEVRVEESSTESALSYLLRLRKLGREEPGRAAPLARSLPHSPLWPREWALSNYNKRSWGPGLCGGRLQGRGWARGGVCLLTRVKSTRKKGLGATAARGLLNS